MSHSFDFLDRSEKDQDFSWRLFPVNIDNGLEDLKKVVFGGLLEVVDGNFVEPACDIDGLNFEFWLLVFVVLVGLKEANEGLIVCRGRCYHYLEVLPGLDDPF